MRATSPLSTDLRSRMPASAQAGQSPWLWYAAFVTTYALFFGLFPVQPLPWDAFGANVLLIAVCFFPLARWKASGGRNIPMFELICLAYGVQFGLVGQLLPNSIVIMSQAVPSNWDSLLHATLLATLGVGGLIVGYEFARRTSVLRSAATLDLPMDRRRTPYFLAAAPFLSAAALLLQGAAAAGAEQFNALIGLLSGLLYLAIVLLAYQFYDARQKTRFGTFLFGFALLVAVAIGLSTGFLERAAAPLVLVVIVRWHQTRKFPAVLVGSLLVVLMLLNSVKGAYRQAAWYGGGGSGKSGVALWWDLATQNAGTIASGQNESAQGAANVLWERLDSLHRFVWVLRQTPSNVPFYEGATYSYLLYGWIPRFVWPDKPSASQGAAYRIDLDYQLITQENVGKTNIGIGGFLPEAFANFGAWGVFFVMAVQGVLFAYLDRLLNGPQSQGGRAIYLAVMVFFLNGIGSSTVTLFGALLQIVFANALILRFFATGWRARPLLNSGRPRGRRISDRLFDRR